MLSQTRILWNKNHRMSATTSTSTSTTSSSSSNPTDQDWDAHQYRSQFSFVYEYGQSLVDLADLRPGESVFDVGCGTGVLTAALMAQGGGGIQAIGMDADPNMIQQAQANFPQATFFQGDARNFTLPQPTTPVDVIFSNAALHWIPRTDMDRTMACLAQSLKSGGRFVVELGGSGNVQQIVAALQHVLHDRHDVTFDCPWYFPTIADFTKHMDNHGIEAHSAVLFDRPTILEDGDEGMNHWLRMFAGQFVGAYLDEATLVAVNDQLRHDLYNGTQWTADYRRLRVIGRKR
jgi:SAM-dependent methyltransferase